MVMKPYRNNTNPFYMNVLCIRMQMKASIGRQGEALVMDAVCCYNDTNDRLSSSFLSAMPPVDNQHSYNYTVYI